MTAPNRTFLFAPGDHARRAEKVLTAGADACILDLEDAVAISAKVAARALVNAALERPRTCRGFVRVNAFDTEVCPGDIHYQEDRDAKPYRRELLRVERTLQEAEALQCKHTILLLHYPPVCDLTKPSGFTDLLEKYHVPLCVFGHLHGMQPGTMFPRRYNGTLLQLVSADYRDCKLLEIKFDGQEALR